MKTDQADNKAKEIRDKFLRLTSLIALPPDSIEAANEAAIICVQFAIDNCGTLDKETELISLREKIRKL